MEEDRIKNPEWYKRLEALYERSKALEGKQNHKANEEWPKAESKKEETTDRDLLVLDVTPLTLGMEASGSVKTKLINRNKVPPTKTTKHSSVLGGISQSKEINAVDDSWTEIEVTIDSGVCDTVMPTCMCKHVCMSC